MTKKFKTSDEKAEEALAAQRARGEEPGHVGGHPTGPKIGVDAPKKKEKGFWGGGDE